jgi:hypothetical protein
MDVKGVFRVWTNSAMADKKQRVERQVVGEVVHQLTDGKSQLQSKVPRALLQHIFSFLHVMDVRSVRSINKFQMLFPRWTILELSNVELQQFGMKLLDALELFATRTERLYSYHFSWYCERTQRQVSWQEALPSLQSVRHLELEGPVVNAQYGIDDFDRILKLPRLDHLQWRQHEARSLHVEPVAPWLQKTRLRVLRLDNVLADIMEAADACALFRQLPDSLIELRVMKTPVAFGKDQLALLLSTCPRLMRVELNIVEKVTGSMRPDDWSLLYSPKPRIWEEWTLNCTYADDPLPCLGVEALDHFARAKVQHTLSIGSSYREQPRYWSSALWKRFVEQTGSRTSPLRVLRFGHFRRFDRLPFLLIGTDDVVTTLMECFPDLEALPDGPPLQTDAKTIIRAYEKKWPLMDQQREFPPTWLNWELTDSDVDVVMDFLARAGSPNRFHVVDLNESLRFKDTVLLHLPQLLLSQRHWRSIDVFLKTTDLEIPDTVATHLARLPQIGRISVDVKSLKLSVHALVDLLQHGGFHKLHLVNHGYAWPHATIPFSVLRHLWTNPRRKFVRLEHVIVNVDGSALAREWTVTRDILFSCLVPTPMRPDKHWTHRKGAFRIFGSALNVDQRVTCIQIIQDPASRVHVS